MDPEIGIIESFGRKGKRTNPLEVLTLRNGGQATENTVTIVMFILRQMMEGTASGTELHYLARYARNPRLTLDPVILSDLQSCGLIRRDGTMHETVRDIILSAIEDEGVSLRLVSPI